MLRPNLRRKPRRLKPPRPQPPDDGCAGERNHRCIMIQMYTYLDVADNTGAKESMCIKVLRGTRRRYAGQGDVIIASVKKALPGVAPLGAAQHLDTHALLGAGVVGHIEVCVH